MSPAFLAYTFLPAFVSSAILLSGIALIAGCDPERHSMLAGCRSFLPPTRHSFVAVHVNDPNRSPLNISAETQPKLHPTLLSLPAMSSQYFMC
jgi:hypothetical protein